jgi:hypothetical protein
MYSLPYLQSLTASQIAQPFFAFHIAGTPLSSHVDTVVLAKAPEKDILSVARELRGLPNLRTLAVDASRLFSLLAFDETERDNGGDSDETYKLARADQDRRDGAKAAYLALLSKVTELRMSGDIGACGALLEKVPTASNLRRLAMSGFHVSGDYGVVSVRLRSAMERLQIEHLTLADSADDGTDGPTWLERGVFPILTSLEVRIMPRTIDILDNLDIIAPNLSSLVLVGYGKIRDEVDYLLVQSTVRLSALKSLSISGSPADFLRLRRFCASPSLRQISLSFSTDDYWPLSDILDTTIVPLPPSLRQLDFDLTTPLKPVDLVLYSADILSKYGAAVHLRWVPRPDLLRKLLRVSGGGEEEGTGRREELRLTERKRAVNETLEWAKEHVQALCRVKDEVGLSHLAQALVRVRQLQAWKEE